MKDCFYFTIFQREVDAVRIKAKLVDDQTETIRKLKDVSNIHLGYVQFIRSALIQSSRVTTYPVYNVSTVITYFFLGPDFT